ncbi:MAG: hypothetical protein EOO90_18595 [Pedobacter sp.]|nr:MAG: hypothetical protein EOO90_18595 [Pedobacter sp.]
MELEEMKNVWQETSKATKKPDHLTNQFLEKMTAKKYNSKINKIGYSEYIGSVICFLAAIYLIINLNKIERPLMQIFAFVGMLLLFILPIISMLSLRNLKNINVSSKTYLEAIEDFGKRKINFLKFQKLNISLALFLLVIAVPVLSAIKGKDIDQTPNFWTLTFPITIAFFLIFALWVLRSYRRILNETAKMLSEINN